MVDYIINENGVERKATEQEKADIIAKNKAWEDDTANRQLSQIREIRNQKLSETDYLGVSDNTMSSDWIAKRKSWRDIPQDYSEADYDELLARDEQGNLTHTVWEKP
jgi:hypothetical protein